MPTASDRDPAAVKSPSRVYLTGFMGSGKTTAGRLLARSLDYRFVDLDAYVEEHAGRSIPTIRSEEHTSELQSRGHLVCRLLLEKKKNLKQLIQLLHVSPH